MENLPPFQERGQFYFRHAEFWDARNGYVFKDYLAKLAAEPKPRPLVELIDRVVGGAGTAASRIWISLPGNLHGLIGFPHGFFKNKIAHAFFSPIASHALTVATNHYAPDQFCTKFPNDLVCKEHGKKVAGILCRDVSGYSIMTFAMDLVTFPPDKDLRKEGLRACCLKNHTSNMPDRADFLFDIANEIIKAYEEFDTLEKIMNMMNNELNQFAKKTYKIELNNPNADLEKDGVVWCSDHPNALCKGYVNGDLYDAYYQLYDVAYYEQVKGNPDAKEADLKTKALKEKTEKEKK